MARFVKGEVVVVPFPFSDLVQTKRRPALIIAKLTGDDLILCQITSNIIKDEYAISIDEDDFEAGGVRKPSNIRPNCIFTTDSNIILYRIGTLKKEKINQVIEKVVEIFRQ